jgi:hypothetical protein
MAHGLLESFRVHTGSDAKARVCVPKVVEAYTPYPGGFQSGFELADDEVPTVQRCARPGGEYQIIWRGSPSYRGTCFMDLV